MQIAYRTKHVSDVQMICLNKIVFLFGYERVVFCWINNLQIVKRFIWAKEILHKYSKYMYVSLWK